jgi:hypothetical protein
VANYGQCQASLRNGERCRVVIVTAGAEFCPHHGRVAAEYGAELVRKGAVPKKRALRSVHEPEPPIVTAMVKATPTAAIDPTSVG